MTLPLLRYQTIPGVGDSNIIDTQAAKRLWRAVLDDKVGQVPQGLTPRTSCPTPSRSADPGAARSNLARCASGATMPD